LGLGISLLFAFPKKAISLTTFRPEEVLQIDLIAAERLYQEWLLARKKTINNHCSCVNTAKSITGINFPPIGLAKNLKPNLKIPSVGSIIITNESKAGHLGAVIAIEGDILTIKEGNYKPCSLSTRQLNISNPVIVGFYR
jgi:hypothetical protein